MPLWSHACVTGILAVFEVVLDVDEAIEVAKSMTNGDMNAMLFTMHPQMHSGIERAVIIRNKRQLEDKLMGFPRQSVSRDSMQRGLWSYMTSR